MAIGGETIGRAYVRILADGSGLSDDIRRQMHDTAPHFEQAGEQNSAAYRRGFNREMRKQGVLPQRDIDNAIREGSGRWDAGGHVLGSAMLNGVRNELEQRFPNDVGTTIFRNLRDQLERGEIDFTGLKQSLRNLRPEVAKATDQIVGAQKQRFEDLGRAVEDYGNTLLKTRNARRGLLTDLQTIGAQLPRNVTDTDAFRRRMEELGDVLTPTGNRLQRMRDRFAQTGETIGRVFGRGSRNDFLNFFGGFVSLAPRMIGGLTGIARGLAGMGQQLRAAFQAGETFREGIGNVVSGLGSLASAGLPGLIAAAIAVGAAIQTVGTLLPAFGAAISLVLGLVLALAGSLGFALVGALVAVAGALVPFAAALGVGALAMAGLGKNNKGLKDLKSTFDDLKKTAAKGVFGKDGAGLANLNPILKSLTPLVEGVSKALGGLLTSLGEAAKTDAFKNMMKGISDLLPGLVTQLGGIGGKLAIGLGQAFVAAGPLIQDFLGFVDDLAGKFAKFGEGGKNSGLAKFFADAAVSAKIIGGLILSIVDALGILFSAGKGTGDSIFASMAEQAEKLVTWLTSPAGQKALKQWFADAEKLAGKIGEIALKVIEFVDALDTPTSRAMLMGILDAVVSVMNAFIWGAGVLDSWNTAFFGLLISITQWLAALPAMFTGTWATIKATVVIAFAEIGQAITDTITDIGAFIGPGLMAVVNAVKLFATAFIQVFIDLYYEIVGGSIVPDMVRDIVSWFARLPGMIAGVLGDLAGRFVTWLAGVPQKIQSSVGLVVGAFSGLAGKAIARAGNIATAFTKWVATLPGKARAMATSAANGFTGLAGKIIAKAGSLASRFASWVASLPGKARSIAASAANAFAGLAGKIIGKAGSIASRFSSWVQGLPGKAKAIANSIANAFSGLANKAIAKAGSITAAMGRWASGVAGRARGVANDIVSGFRGLAGRIVSAIGTIIPKIKMPNIPRPTVQAIVKVIKPGASGFVTNGPEVRLIGEAGPEAVVPLNRALSRVDPAVRALSAFAQGIPQPGGGSGTPSIGRNIEVGGITINTPTEDPRAVASEVVNRMTFAAYI